MRREWRSRCKGSTIVAVDTVAGEALPCRTSPVRSPSPLPPQHGFQSIRGAIVMRLTVLMLLTTAAQAAEPLAIRDVMQQAHKAGRPTLPQRVAEGKATAEEQS